MDEVEAFQIFSEPPINHLVAIFDPREARNAIFRRRAVKVDQDVILCHQLIQRRQNVPSNRNIF